MQPSHPESVGSLYAEHRSWLQTWLHRKLGCPHKAEDLAQDTFLKVLLSQASAALREPRAFLTTVAHGLVVSHWRRLDLERAYLDALATQGQPLSASPEDRALALEALQQVDTLLAGLPAKARQAFLLARLDGLGYAEIAAELGVSDRMVKKYMAQAMHRLLLNDAA
ncbi:sigma-70 family RNA polymerase sigma factor [Pseudorhodoferax sp.]|uniref:sigma-70 family RNA polymerase sigma factor n=1 Tax=Pseudorhodoferax sp. TaxID=1993553 RepID=UPI002DD6627C|nr:sigma-70 family RNA polymerase sigma factor [Pseudorhodoferax sp.]